MNSKKKTANTTSLRNTRGEKKYLMKKKSSISRTRRNQTTTIKYTIQSPTKSNAKELLATVLKLKPSAVPLTPLTESEWRKIYSGNIFPPEYIQRFTKKGFITSCLFLKRTHQNKKIFNICIELFPILYGISLTSADIRQIHKQLKYVFQHSDILADKNNQHVVEIKGGMPGPFMLFIAFMDMHIIYNVLLTQIYYKSLIEGVDECVSSMQKLVDRFDKDVTHNTGKSLEDFYEKIKGTDADPSKSLLGYSVASTSWLIYTEQVRNTVAFKDNQRKILKYVELGIQGINSNLDVFTAHYTKTKDAFLKKEDTEYREETAIELKKINKASKLAKRIVRDEANADEKNKVYTHDSIENLEKSVEEVIELEKEIQKQLVQTASSNTNIVTNDDFQTLINYLDILFGKLQECKMGLELRPEAVECEYPVQAWKDIKTSSDYFAFAADHLALHAAQVSSLVRYALNTQAEIISHLTEEIQDYYTHVFNTMDNITVLFRKVHSIVQLDIPTHYTILFFLYNKLKTTIPLIGWYIYTFLSIIVGVTVNVCAIRQRMMRHIDNRAISTNKLLLVEN